MEVIVTKQFAKDTEKELDKTLQLQVADIIEQLKIAATPQEITNIKKLKGYKTAYRIKIGLYRIGFIYESNKIILSRVMHRKEIYRYFP
jgi:mRNA interferase RelE/StbE